MSIALLKQGYYIGNKTLPLISITGFIMGLVLTIQSRPVLIDLGAQTLLPGISISCLVYDEEMAENVDTVIVKANAGIDEVMEAAETIETSWIFNLFSLSKIKTNKWLNFTFVV